MTEYDVIIVGARAAGAGTALLLARSGWNVLVLDRARRGSDTLSTHALMRPGVLQLQRWGLLDEVIAAGTPAQDRVVFHYGDTRLDLDVSHALYAPRRTVLEPILVAAAERSGAHFRFGVDVRNLLRDPDGRVAGVRVRDEHGTVFEVRGHMTVGADGRRSLVAREVDAPVTRRGTGAGATVYGYWDGVEAAGFEWCFRPGTSAGLIPTNDGEVCVFATVPPRRFVAELRHDREGGLHRVLAETTPEVAERVAAGRRTGHVRAFPGLLGWLRRPWGDGWALVGDAGHFKDPTTAHGITDGLRDAELLARALDRLLCRDVDAPSALSAYEQTRNDLSIPMFDITDAIARLDWTLDEVQPLHLALSAEMTRESEVLAGLEAAAVPSVAA